MTVTTASGSRAHKRGLAVARGLALAVMLFCVSILVWSLVLFPAAAGTNLDFIRPQNNWTDDVLRAAIHESGYTVETLAYFKLATILFPALFYLIVAGIIFARHSTDWFSLYLSVLFVVFGTVANSFSRLVGSLNPAMGLILSGLGNGGWIGLFPVFYLFPDGKFVPRWTWVMMVLWAGFVALLLLGTSGLMKSLSDVEMSSPLSVIGIPLAILIFVVAAVSQVYRYFWHSNAIQRQQTKWVLGAIILFVASVVFSLGSLALAQPGQEFTANDLRIGIAISFMFGVVGAIFPITVGIAILRYRLWDIDILIRRTLQYSILSGLLALTYFGLVIVLQNIFAAITGQQSAVVIVISTLAIAALFFPLRARVQDFIDRSFFRRKYDAQKILAEFAATARDETDLDKLTARLTEVVKETMQPEKVSLWLKTTDDGRPTTLSSAVRRQSSPKD